MTGPDRPRLGHLVEAMGYDLGPEPVSLARREELLAEVSQAVGFARPSSPYAGMRDCPACGADPGESCTRPSLRRGRIKVSPHPTRLQGLL